MNGIQDEFTDLLGAYALDAVDPLERKRIEGHLETCDACATELRSLQDAAAELSGGSESALPDGFADRVIARVDAAPGGRLRRVVASVVAAAALVAAIAGGYFVATQNARDIDHLVAVGRPLALRSTGSFPGYGTIYLGRDRAAVVLSNVPDPGHDHAYQLWAIHGKTPSSVAVLDEHGNVRSLVRTRPAGATYAVTVEPAAGSKQPTTPPVLTSS